MDWKLRFRWIFAIVCIIAGIILNIFINADTTVPFESVGNYLIVVGIIIILINIFRQLFKDNKIKTDERTNYIAFKASRILYVLIVLFAFAIMIWDMIKPITIRYYSFLSMFICITLLAYTIIFKILEKYN